MKRAAVLLTISMMLSCPGCGGNVTGNSPPAGSAREITARKTSIAVMWGQRVGWEDLGLTLSELSGRTALEELAIDRGLSRRMEDRGFRLAPGAIEDERARLASAMGSNPDAVDRFRRTRGLGPARFEGLLRRNAMLRMLAGEIEPEEQEIERLYALRHGPRRECRVLIAGNATEAGSIRESLQNMAGEHLEWAFARAAFDRSVDPSAAAGGYIGAIHPLDPALPSAVREALLKLEDGELSPVILAEGGAALLLPIGTVRGSGIPVNEARSELESEARSKAQRAAMDALVRDILQEAGITVLDKSLEWGWRNGGR